MASNRTSRVARALFTASVLAAALVQTACAPKSGGFSSSAPSYASPDVLEVDIKSMADLGYRRDWISYPRIAKGYPIVDILKSEGMIGVLGGGNTVSFMSDTSGEVRWSDRPSERQQRLIGLAPITYKGARALLMSTEARGYILDRDTGAIQVVQDFDQVVNTGPIIDGRLAIYGTSAGTIIAHDVAVSQRRWSNSVEGAIKFGPTAMDGAVAVVGSNGGIRFLNPQTGTVFGRNSMLEGIAAEPATDGRRLFVASLDQNMYAFATNGRQLWRYPTPEPLRVSPGVVGNTVYFEQPGLGLVALDADTGDQKWVAEGIQGQVLGSIEGRILVWDGLTATLLLPATGSLDIRIDFPGVERFMLDALEDGNIYVTGKFGGVAKYVPTLASLRGE